MAVSRAKSLHAGEKSAPSNFRLDAGNVLSGLWKSDTGDPTELGQALQVRTTKLCGINVVLDDAL